MNTVLDESDAFREDWPLTRKEMTILETNHRSLVDLLDLTDLLGRLYSSDVINRRQMDSISSKPTSHEKNEALLDILRRRSLRDYIQTIACLRLSQQRHIAETLDKGGGISQIGSELVNWWFNYLYWFIYNLLHVSCLLFLRTVLCSPWCRLIITCIYVTQKWGCGNQLAY